MALLEIANLSLSFSGLRALADVSFDVGEGEIVGLIGPNGAGKSTLLNCVSRLYRPQTGHIRFNGADLVGPQDPRACRDGNSPHASRTWSCSARRACART